MYWQQSQDEDCAVGARGKSRGQLWHKCVWPLDGTAAEGGCCRIGVTGIVMHTTIQDAAA